MFFDKLEHQIKETPYCKLLDNVFGGQTCTTITCTECGQKTKRFENFYNLSLEVKNQNNLFESFRQLIKEEKVQDFFCNVCNKKQDIQKAVTVSTAPNFLILHLKRIVFDFDIMENEKINSLLEFPQVSQRAFPILRPWTSAPTARSARKRSSTSSRAS